MNNTPLVSVLIPAYNAGRFIAATLESVLKQSFKDFEVVILNDCSNDNTKEVIKSVDDARIRYYENDTNRGIAYTRNRLIDLARGKYLAILDADDLCYANRLQLQYDFLAQNKGFVFVGAGADLIDEESEVFDTIVYSRNADLYPSVLFFHNTIFQSSVMINKSYLDKLIGDVYDLSHPPAEDYDLWVRLASLGKIQNLREVLIQYRVHPESVSNSKDDLMEKSVDRIIRKNLLRLELPFSEREFLIQKSFIYKGVFKSENISLLELDRWLFKLLKQNQVRRLFEHRSFLEIVKSLWLRRVNLEVREYSPQTFRMLSSHSIFRELTVKEKLKFFVKSFSFYRYSSIQSPSLQHDR